MIRIFGFTLFLFFLLQILASGDVIGIIQVVILIFGALCPFFLLCHFGGNVTNRFEKVGDDVYQLEWYNLPIEMQKQLPIIMASAQKPIYIRGYGDTRSTYFVFKKVFRIVFKNNFQVNRFYMISPVFFYFTDFEKQILLLYTDEETLSVLQKTSF